MPLDPYAAAGTYTAEQEIVDNINSAFLPSLRRLLTETLAFLDTPIASLGMTPRQVLLTRYTRV